MPVTIATDDALGSPLPMQSEQVLLPFYGIIVPFLFSKFLILQSLHKRIATGGH